MRRPLCTLLLTAAVVAAFYAGAGFVTPRSKAPVPPQQRPLAVTPSFDTEKESTPNATEESSPSFVKWVGAGLMAGLVAAGMSAAPAAASPNGIIDWVPGKQERGSPVQFIDENGFTVTPDGKRASNAIITYSETRKAREVYRGLSVKNWVHMEPCKDSKKFKKRIKDQMFKVSARQKKYPKGSLMWEKLNSELARAKKRQEAYGGRWCTKATGAPMTIANGELTRGGIVPAALTFLYTTGWIGWAGRTYLRSTRDVNKELKIDVPLALKIMCSGFAWPVLAWKDIVDGKFVVPDKDVPRNTVGTVNPNWEGAPGYQ